MPQQLPLLIEPEALADALSDPMLRIVDLRDADAYAEGHIAGAVHLDYESLITGTPPAPGKVPATNALAQTLSEIGISTAHHVVSYDDAGGGAAARLIWTLHLLGDTNTSLLDGGIGAWRRAGLPLSVAPPSVQATTFVPRVSNAVVAEKDYILSRLGAADFALLDARSPEEHAGTMVRAARGGHIPGAANLNWLDTMDGGRRYLPADTLRSKLTERGLTQDKEIVTYCQTHHRSSHAYVMLKSLGYPRVRGYPGSWSEWGNDPDTPVAT